MTSYDLAQFFTGHTTDTSSREWATEPRRNRPWTCPVASAPAYKPFDGLVGFNIQTQALIVSDKTAHRVMNLRLKFANVERRQFHTEAVLIDVAAQNRIVLGLSRALNSSMVFLQLFRINALSLRHVINRVVLMTSFRSIFFIEHCRGRWATNGLTRGSHRQ